MISIVIPAFNEEKALPHTISAIQDALKKESYEIIVVNDGSVDQTAPILEKLHKQDARIHFITLSRNFGHQAALLAGLEAATGDAVISIDADMEQPPALIPKMIQAWQEGADIVYCIHQEAAHEGWFKKTTSRLFYKIFNALSGIHLQQACDFRLMDRKVVDVIKQAPERALFLRGLVVWTGFKTKTLTYVRGKRIAGNTHYTLKKMINLALNGLLSFSTRPLHLIVLLGLFVAMIGVFLLGWIFYLKLFTHQTITGWSSLMAVILCLGGAQLLVLGIIGEYIGILVQEVKRRPRYLIQSSSLHEKTKDSNA